MKWSKRWNWRKWLDGFALAGRGILLATRQRRFWVGFIISFLFFGTLMNLLDGGMSKIQLMGASGFGGAMKILGDSFLGAFGVNKTFSDWLPIFAIAALQGVLVGLIVLLWQQERAANATNVAQGTKISGAKTSNATKVADGNNITKVSNAANVEKAGIITGLIALGAGCPTCGTTLITPLIGAFVSTGSLAIAGVVSTIVTWLAIVIAILALRRIGEETYVYLIYNQYVLKEAQNGKAK